MLHYSNTLWCKTILCPRTKVWLYRIYGVNISIVVHSVVQYLKDEQNLTKVGVVYYTVGDDFLSSCVFQLCP